MNYIRRIITKFKSKEIVIWAGSGVSKYCNLPLGSELVKILKDNMDKNEREECEDKTLLPEVAQIFVEYRNGSKNELIKILKKIFSKKFENIYYHKLLADIPYIHTIITTNYDKTFEKAYKNDINIIYNDSHIPFQKLNNKTRLYKIHGDILEPNSIIITNDDYEKFYGTKLDSPIWTKIKSIIAEYSILFIGYSLDDSHIKYLFNTIKNEIGPLNNEHFFVAPNLPSYKMKKLIKMNINYLNTTSEKLIEGLSNKIKENIIKDGFDGNIDPNSLTKYLNKRGIYTKLYIDNGKIKSLSFGPKKNKYPVIKGNFSIEKNYYNENIDFFSGKRFGNLNIPKDKVKNVTAKICDIPLPSSNNIEKFNLQFIPQKVLTVNLILKKSGLIIENIKSQVYESGELIELHIIHGIFIMILSINKEMIKKGSNEINFSISINKSNDIPRLKLVYEFLYKLFKNDTLIIETLDNNEKLELPFLISKEIKNKFIKESKFFYDFYNDLFQIQNQLNIKFTLPNSFTRKQFTDTYFLVNIINNKKQKLKGYNFRITLKKQNIPKSLKLQDISPFFLYSDKDLIIELFNYKIIIKIEYIKIFDAYIKNKDNFPKQIETDNELVVITIGSRSDYVLFKYEDIRVEKIKNSSDI